MDIMRNEEKNVMYSYLIFSTPQLVFALNYWLHITCINNIVLFYLKVVLRLFLILNYICGV